MEEPLQKSLERYDVLDRIAVGGMAEVFLAKAYGAHGFEKTLAIKRILPELARDPEFEARFIAEAKVAVRLSHANVVQVFDFGRIGESLFIAMEYVDGLDLAALLRKLKDEDRLVPLPAAFHIAIEIIRALDFAHQHGVVHRDVSPSNILISRAGEVKIGDFGIAVAAQPHKAGGPGPKKVMGKWRYMSPEQARGDTLDTRSDMFSAASVLFELFTGAKLFPGDEAEDIIENIERMPIPKASSVRPALPSRLDDILAGPLSRKPIDRPNRPAIVLRSLIELSYESSIMATALDVAEAVASVLPAKRVSGSNAAPLDDVIRKQLGQADKSVARRTAITSNKPPSTETLERGEVSTGLFRKIAIGDDGVSRLEEIDPTAVAAPRARRASEGPPLTASSTDSGLHKLLDAHFDPDRRTEVGGPPTGAVPKSEPLAEGTAKSVTATLTGTPRRRLALGIAAIAIAGGGVGAWAMLHGKSEPVVAVPGDAGAEHAVGYLSLDSIPGGADITVAGDALGKGPKKAKVPAGVKLHIKMELAGYTPFEDDVTVDPNITTRIHPTLQPSPAKLHVETTPIGADVSLAGRPLGQTPINAETQAQTGAELVIAKPGYETVKEKVDLVAGQTTTITRELKEGQRFGFVTIAVTGGWGNVYFKNANLGRAPGMSGPLRVRLPVGHQILRLENPPSHKTWNLACDVVENEVHACNSKLGG